MQLLSFEVQLPKSISGRINETPQTCVFNAPIFEGRNRKKDMLRINFEESRKYFYFLFIA